MSLGELLNIHARERAGVGDDWEIYEFRCMPPEGPTLYYALVGAVAPVKARGKHRGRRDWGRMDKTTIRTVNIPAAEHRAWVEGWSASTGKCPGCVGEGDVFASWSRAEGTKTRPCGACGGTGKAEVEAMEDVPVR
jgi:hypothetical protein